MTAHQRGLLFAVTGVLVAAGSFWLARVVPRVSDAFLAVCVLTLIAILSYRIGQRS